MVGLYVYPSTVGARDGDFVGAKVGDLDGARDGDDVGTEEDGAIVGARDGDAVGKEEDGALVGGDVGCGVEGAAVGAVGDEVGEHDAVAHVAQHSLSVMLCRFPSSPVRQQKPEVASVAQTSAPSFL